MQLHHDAPPPEVLAEEVLLDLLAGLRERGPVVVEPGGAHRPACLRPPGQQPRRREVVGQVGGEPPALGGGHPPTEPDTRGDHHVVDRPVQGLAGGRQQVGVLGEGHQADRGSPYDPGAPPFQQGRELLPAAGRGHPDGEPGQRVGRRLEGGQGIVQKRGCHSTLTSTVPLVTRVGYVGSAIAGSSRQTPVTRENTCLCMGVATTGSSPLVPVMPRDITYAPL